MSFLFVKQNNVFTFIMCRFHHRQSESNNFIKLSAITSKESVLSNYGNIIRSKSYVVMLNCPYRCISKTFSIKSAATVEQLVYNASKSMLSLEYHSFWCIVIHDPLRGKRTRNGNKFGLNCWWKATTIYTFWLWEFISIIRNKW